MASRRLPGRTLLESALAERYRQRCRLAKVLHDDIGQTLTGLGLEIEMLRLDAEDQNSPFGPRLGEIQRSLEAVFRQVRALNDDVQPDPVGRFGFTGALERLGARFQAVYQGKVFLDFAHQVEPASTIAGQLYEITECGLDNVLQHSYSSQVTLSTATKRSRFEVALRDNGIGFDIASARRGIGLTLLDRGLQGSIRGGLSSRPRRGTILRLSGASEAGKIRK